VTSPLSEAKTIDADWCGKDADGFVCAYSATRAATRFFDLRPAPSATVFG
jgi:hypothetical protein